MKNRFYHTILLFGFILCVGCQDFLDPTPTNKYSNKFTWESEKNATLYLNGFYTYISIYGNFGNGQFGATLLTDGLTDQLKYAGNVAGVGTPNLYAYYPERITPDQNSLGVWNDAYERVRRVNEALLGLNEFAKFPEEKKKDFEGQLRFFRSYIYFQLMKRHKSVILLDKPTSHKDNPRASEAEGWDFIEKDLNEAIASLPVTRPAAESGRLTKGMALAFKSRVMLYAQRWDKAKTAAQECIDLKDDKGGLVYELNPEYKKAFASYEQGNKEAILYFRYVSPSPTHNFDKNYVPGGDYAGLGALAGPTQEMVEEYELATGGKPDWSKWRSKTTETPPYELLEPRFKASILYNGASWKGRKVEAFVGGADGFQDYGSASASNGHTVTGYFLRKNLDEKNTDVEKNLSTQPWIEIRLAEVYLNLAEAAAELKDAATANQALTAIRKRVNLPWSAKTGDALMQAVRHERKVELAFEGQYYWDLRRWNRAMTELNNVRFHGLKIEKNGNSFSYQYVVVDDQVRKYTERLQKSFPIPSAELANNSAIQQLDEWK